MTEALIFDFDGLIADTESAIYEAWAAHQAGSPCVIVPSPVTLGSDFTGAHGILPSLAGVSTNELLNYLRSTK